MSQGMSLDECMRKASAYIKFNGSCLLLFDVKASRKVSNRALLQSNLELMMDDLNQKFENYFSEHNLAVVSRKEKGFKYLLGDGSWTGITDATIIPNIVLYQAEHYPDISLYWCVAKDGYDKEGISLVL